ncbi:hypothetical protein llap_14831 [Limosa lapponica baueri]|uniref:Chromatin-remodeling ATPase INO80 n=1 Tax=Limosa lapponica baueri TaxID=1758121 RepID=A0A2I0TM83_LIMLA|nr:hypothetical protein llap_14831 [Limosa lapponica baueri]
MASELGAREDGSCSELAKPLYLQYLEKALQLDQFLRQTSAIFNRSISSDESEDGLDDNPLLPQSGDPLMQVKEEPPNSLLGEPSGAGNSGMLNTHSLNGVLQPEPKSEKGSLYNFSKLKKSRKWLKSILLSDDSSDTDSPSDEDGEEEEEFSLSREELHNMLRLHKYKKLHQSKYSKDKEAYKQKASARNLFLTNSKKAKRQQRKLNFLITQTELYAHFMSRKRDIGHDGIQEEILRKLEDSSTQRQIDIGGGVVVNITQEDYDSNYYKAQALKNAEDAYQIHQARTRSFDEDAKESRAAALRAANKSGTGFGESYSLANPSIRAGEDIPQPTIFNGKLKGYQLKGMNWLANLYEQRENIWGPFLIISPASTLNNWHQEFARFVPKFKKTLYTQDAPFHVVITSYQLVVQDVKYFQRVKWQYMVLDEAQALKSSSSVRWKILLQFQCRNRLLLTGTPIQNTMAEIEILMYCQQTSRQKLLYQALKNKISIDDLLQSSMGTTQQAQTTTSSLMNLVMQFRKNLVFSSHCKAVTGYTDHVIHRRRSATSCVRCCQVTELPSFLCMASPRVTAVPLEFYCNDRSAEYERRALREGGSLEAKQCVLHGAPELAAEWLKQCSQFFPEYPGGLLGIRPQNGWSFIRIPDKESLITDSGKLHALDLLLTRLKSQGHRVLIYSQMTRMIDLLEKFGGHK